MESQHALIFTGGDAPHPDASRLVRRSATVIAVDSGWEHARASGAVPHVLVGDMDSISPEHLAEAERLGVEVVRHPVDKDLTDAEIALELAVERGFTVITVVSGGGDRIDHVIGFVNAAAAHSAPERRVDIVVGRALIAIVSPGALLTATVGAEPLVSLVPLGGPAHGVTTRGLRWELSNETLAPLASRGVSNVPLAAEYSVALTDGRLAVIEP
ncbi:MAG: thiamine diphosphokinase, partial [Ilumatobacteraceae bacterium]